MKLESIDHVALYVRDVARSVAWYRDVLGLERRYAEAWADMPAVMAAGATGVALFPATSAARVSDERAPLRFAHLAFRTSAAGLRAAKEHLASLGIAYEEQDHAIARSVYFADPDGHRLEVTTYEV